MGEVGSRVDDVIRGMIAIGRLRSGDRLPSERVLVAALDASRSTVRLVLVRLVAEGLVRSERRGGYVVCEPKS
jgi:DNA-binding GntR family transcriptional regulator